MTQKTTELTTKQLGHLSKDKVVLNRVKGCSYRHAYVNHVNKARDKNKEPLKEKEYKKLMDDFAEEVGQELEDGGIVQLPGIGRIWVKKYKIKTDALIPNYPESKRLGKMIYFVVNEDDFYVTIKWFKFYNKEFRRYIFKPAHKLKARVSARAKAPGGHKRYFERL